MDESRAIKIGTGLLAAAVALMVVWVAARTVSGLYVDLLWFEALGLESVFWTLVKARGGAAGVALAVSVAALGWGVWSAYRRAPLPEEPVFPQAGMESGELDRVIRRVLVAGIGLVSLILALSVSVNWLEFLHFRHGGPFGVAEPVFGRDIGFYVFRLPAIAYVFRTLFLLSLLSMGFSLAVYMARGAVSWGDPKHVLAPAAFRHLSATAGVATALFAARFWVARYQVLLAKRGAVFGAGYTDIHAQIGAYGVVLAAALALACWFLVNAGLRRRRANIFALAGFVTVWFVAGTGYPWAVQTFRVRPNEFAREEEYLRRNIEFTRKAYGLDGVEYRAWAGDGTLTRETLDRREGTVDNLQLWDSGPLLSVYNQKQRIRGYYHFNDVDVDRYEIDGRTRPVMVSVRELASELLPEINQVWTNLHLQYTHGYGFCMSFGNRIEAEGLPEFLARNIPPETRHGIEASQPRVYFGELTRRYALVQTQMEEFDYPGDPENHFNRYDGGGGVPVGGPLRRALLSWYTGDTDILFTGQFTEASRILLHRQIQGRVMKIAPFLRLDEDPYPVTHEGGVVWVLDAYTHTGRFPYSEPLGRANYLRNSVKATVDAYDGTVRLYKADADDPMLAVYDRVFPGLFRPMDEMPATLRRHMRYPKDLFRVQTMILCRYHVDDPRVFFNGEDVWTFPVSAEDGAPTPEPPRYMVMELPGEEPGAEYVLARTFTVEGRDNMIAWMAAGCDGDRYGRLTLYTLPKRLNIYGPNQAKGRFNQDPEVSSFMTLMGQLGSEVLQSKVLVVPIDDGVLYLQSLYIEDPDVRIPELKQVVVGLGDAVAMAPTVAKALERLLGEASAPVTEAMGPEPREASEAQRLYREAMERMRAGDWARFGEAFEALGRALGAAP